jgi:hypothetical protein
MITTLQRDDAPVGHATKGTEEFKALPGWADRACAHDRSVERSSHQALGRHHSSNTVKAKRGDSLSCASVATAARSEEPLAELAHPVQ